jgi:hypothetical protein
VIESDLSKKIMENEPANPKMEGEINAGTNEVDPMIAEEAEQFLRQALEDSNRYGINLGLTPESAEKSTVIMSNMQSPASEASQKNEAHAQGDSHGTHIEAKQEIAARLRKRIQEKEAMVL